MIQIIKTLIVLTGLPGSGKTTAAKHVKNYLGAQKNTEVVYFNTDTIRETLFPQVKKNIDRKKGDFTSGEIKKVYQALDIIIDTIGQLKHVNKSMFIIIDGSFRKRKQRVHLFKKAKKFKTVLLYIRSNKRTTLSRLKKRVELGLGSGVESYYAVEKDYEIPDSLEALIIDNDSSKTTFTTKVIDCISNRLEKT